MKVRQICILLLCLYPVSGYAGNLPLHQLSLPDGFSISLYTDKVPNARSMTLSPSGTLFVGSRQEGKVYAVLDKNKDGKADRVIVIAEGLNSPNGVAFHKGSLYVAEINRILRFDKIEWNLRTQPVPEVVSTDFPADEHHGWKFIRIGPDEKLYVPIGAPCNVCLEYGYAAITRLNLDGSVHEIYAEGVRNTVGFDWHPTTKELWFTDSGRDQLGDDKPADELNRAPKSGMHFGFPYCHGGDVLDPEYGLGHQCREYTAPVQKLGAHVAALGMRFYTGNMFPPEYRHQIFIAEHGSRISSGKVGYQVSLVTLNGNKAASYTPFVQGWLQGESAWGRPVDVATMKDGSLLISDDKAGAIYRVVYKAVTKSPATVLPADNNTPAKRNLPQISVEPAQVPEQTIRRLPEANSEQQAVSPDNSSEKNRSSKNIPPAEVLRRHEQRPADETANDPFTGLQKQQLESVGQE